MTDTTAFDEGFTTPPPPALLSIPAVCTYLSVSRSLVYELIGAGELTRVKVGGSARVTVASLEAYVARITNAAEVARSA